MNRQSSRRLGSAFTDRHSGISRLSGRQGACLESFQSPREVSGRHGCVAFATGGRLRHPLRDYTFMSVSMPRGPCSCKNLSVCSAFMPFGMFMKFTKPTGALGKNPHSSRIWMHVSISRARPQPAWHNTRRSHGFLLPVPN
jgi:hypothetical protein